MKRYKQLAATGVVLSIVGVLAGCATGGGTSTGLGSKTNNMNDTVSNMTVNKTSANNTVVPIPSNNTALSTNTSNTASGDKSPSTISTMPKHPYWTELTSEKPTIKTGYGTVSFSQLGITKNDISVFITSSGVKDTLYKLSDTGFKQVDGWQMQGSYLALRFGLPYSANPTTGDYSYKDVVIDLKTQQVVLTTGSAVQSVDYLDSPYFINTAMQVEQNGNQSWFCNITNLDAHKKITYEFPDYGLGIESHGVLYYPVSNGTKQQIVSMALPKTGWQSMKDKWNPIQLPSNGQ
ncbi:hypothetical protein [Alicyclobacillus mengziensis]|uniref:Lipoprotein n=1 Tax=Alicyclobacillus mengziensis TaxID=2931921 RepID=A0A9X7VXY4_9BACL|nr:hypothetical protein [Alicyclobacillus mengziensis]QSO46739.1 hypothetical protein JZ786_20220 [Alicyclobacillus mengziensis]